MKKILMATIASLGLMLAGLSSNVYADDFIKIDYANHNLYQTGGVQTIKESIKGDFYCAAEKCIVDKYIKGDVIAAAETIEINAFIEGNVRAAAKKIVFNEDAVVTRNATLAASEVNVMPGATIKQDLMIAGSDLDLNLILGRDILIAAENVKIFGKVAGQTDIRANRIYIDQKAEMTGDASLKAKQFDLDKKSFKANLSQQLIKENKKEEGVYTKFFNNHGFNTFRFFHSLISAIIVTLILYLFLKNRKQDQKPNFVLDFVIGLGVSIMLPIASLTILLLSPRLAFVVLSVWLAILLLAPMAAIYVLAKQIVKTQKIKISFVLFLVLMVIAYKIVGIIPIIGSLVNLFCFGLGMGYLTKKMIKK